MIQSSRLRKYSYIFKIHFKGFDKTELIFVNPHDFNINMSLNGAKYSITLQVKIIDFKDAIANMQAKLFLGP